MQGKISDIILYYVSGNITDISYALLATMILQLRFSYVTQDWSKIASYLTIKYNINYQISSSLV